ncbi:hypothetical protein NH287_14400 [Microbacterium sp. CnD16-F]|uniref:hypothetical protein n=1 Tax=Microbacterium sp. CnD16-F TaxID=2954493 RepID=UPI00209809C7|nr:hypothetical protein [Microbacterium sp. CnD16-F]MCO7204678.1 hypothetical protein [Microbacterium sp. CnD16-F]
MVSQTPADKVLHRISKATAVELRMYKEGVHHETATKRTIDDLRHQSIADRLQLADSFRDAGSAMLRRRPPLFRLAVGRFYYAMYHYMRAVVFYEAEGDDHQSHSELPKRVPADFPNDSVWKNNLKDARYRRNEADYDAYPIADVEFRDDAKQLELVARSLAVEARNYLRAKGCTYV